MTRWAFLDHPRPIAFAHRGGGGEHPENTMAAFAHAVNLGYQYLETDVHTTVDGMLVAFHDPVLDRLTDRCGTICETPWSEVAAARVECEPIPLLEDILGSWPDVRVNIDPKADTCVDALMAALVRTNSLDRVCIASFSTPRLERIRRLSGGRVCTALGPSEITRVRLAGWGLPVRRPRRGACVQVPLVAHRIRLIEPAFLAAAHRWELPVHVWTVDDEAEMNRLLELGVSGLMTDRPALLKAVMQKRGDWADSSG
ncbi:MAG: glycerophosphodiester phosphodiesterase [Acidimicrobiales bacterium]